jgi:hypothetical protein
LIIVPLPPAKGRSIGTDSLWLSFRGMPRKLSQGIKTGENSRPTNGEDTTPAHNGKMMEVQNVALKDLLPGFIELDQSGVVRLAELQAQGYVYLRL